jgi:hypothetical protein
MALWLMLVAGSVVFLRRGYASAAVSTLLGASVMVLTGTLNLLILIGPLVFKWDPGRARSRFMVLTELAWHVGLFLFALGFLQLARMTRREG